MKLGMSRRKFWDERKISISPSVSQESLELKGCRVRSILSALSVLYSGLTHKMGNVRGGFQGEASAEFGLYIQQHWVGLGGVGWGGPELDWTKGEGEENQRATCFWLERARRTPGTDSVQLEKQLLPGRS